MWTFPTSEYSNHLDIHTMSPGKLPKPAKHITVEQGLRQAKAVTADGNKLALFSNDQLETMMTN